MYDWIREKIDQSSHYFLIGSKTETVVCTSYIHSATRVHM